MRLIKSDFKTLADFVDEYNVAVLSEYSQPWASLYINGEKTTQLKSGNVVVKSTTGYVSENATMITAIYEVTAQGNKLYKCSMCEDKTNNTYEFVFGQLQIDQNKNYAFKFFYWDEADGLKPVEVFNSVYREIYVETDGDDTLADGSPERPYKTIVAAMDKVAEINKYQ